MARKTLRLDTSGLEGLLRKVEEVGGNVEQATEKALRRGALEVQDLTISAVASGNLPRGGKYSSGDTARSIIHFPSVEWEGSVASIPVGFDFSKPGAGGFLISGRRQPTRMAPDKALRELYKGKTKMNQIQDIMFEDIMKQLEEAWK